jgi:hypothetical protein
MKYVDDVCLICHRFKHIQRKLDDLWEESKNVGLVINSSKTKEIHVNTTANKDLRLNSRDKKRSSDFCYLGSVVSEDGGARTDVNMKNLKAGGQFSKLRKVWLSASI